jgi:hypothetical protein
MSYFTRKTFNEGYGQHPLDPEPSGALQFMRRRRAWMGGGGGLAGTLWDIMPIGMVWAASWGALSVPFEAGRAAVRTVSFLEQLGAGGREPEFAQPVVDTRMAYTMRRAALDAMHNSAYSLRGAIGNEANLAHS